MYNSAYVFSHLGSSESMLVGKIHTSNLKGEFQYTAEWLDNPKSYSLDPVNLPLIAKRFQVHNLRNTFGVFSDAGPDAWGERIFLQHHQSLPKNEVERLLRLSGMGVGCLKFSLSRTRPKKVNTVPTMDLVSRLSDITQDLMLKRTLTNDELRLIDPGSSMGGARPKVTVSDGCGEWLVKFGRPDDLIDNPRVEFASMQMLTMLGIKAPETTLMEFAHGKCAYLIKRFDRIPNKPIHFISAHSLFNTDRVRQIQDANQDPRSYIALARHLRAYSAKPIEDCSELYRRMVANVLIGNTDDHARNHGMVYDIQTTQWRLAPAYDILPILGVQGEQALGIGKRGRASTINNLLSSCTSFGLSKEEALACIHELREGIENWPNIFSEHGVCEMDITMLRSVILKAH